MPMQFDELGLDRVRPGTGYGIADPSFRRRRLLDR